MSLFNELKRRNVFKVAIAYIVVAWFVLQVADVVLNNITAPGWVFKVLMLFVAIGFPFAVIFAWAFEMTPEGIKREHQVDRSQSITRETGQKLNYTIIAVLALALGYFAYDKFVLTTGRDVAMVEATTKTVSEQAATGEAPVQSDNSIAVLPFADMSPNKDQDYFSDGLSEELLNLLAKIPELRVAARTSSFSFKSQNLEIPEIAERLKVAHILEGSVRTAGDQIRVTAQLIRADNGYHMWSQTYDRNLDNVFAIQDEIATEVVAQLKLTLLGTVPTANKTDPQAYAYFLQARQLSRQFTSESVEQANSLYQKALELDPEYSKAWAELARNYINQAGNGLLPREEGLSLARQAISKALDIEPDLAEGFASKGWIAMMYEGDLATATRYFERALLLEPTNLDIIRNVAYLAGNLGHLEQAINFSEYVVERDPLNLNGQNQLAGLYIAVGRMEEALKVSRTILSVSPDRIGGHNLLGVTLLLMGKTEEALAEFTVEVDEEYRAKGSAMALHKLGRQAEHEAALKELKERWGDRWPSDVAEVYAWAGNSDAAFTWLEKELKISGHLIGANYSMFLVSLHDDPRWPEILNRGGVSPEQLKKIKLEVELPH